MSEPLNLFDLAVEADSADPPGYRDRMAQFAGSIGAERLGGSVYELDPGESTAPYHYEGVEEEWLLVLTGAPAFATPRASTSSPRATSSASPWAPAARTR